MPMKLDEHGHLSNRSEWSKNCALLLAKTDDISLTSAHWQIIEAVQILFDETGDTPPMRLLIKLLRNRLGTEVDSRFLYRLFPDNPVRQASKYAGLPKPKHCM